MRYLSTLLMYNDFGHRTNITKRKTLKYIVYVFLFVLIFCLPTFGIWKWEYDNGILKAKPTNLLYDKTFNMVYFAVLNGSLRAVLPTLCLIVFNILIYKEVRIVQTYRISLNSIWETIFFDISRWGN